MTLPTRMIRIVLVVLERVEDRTQLAIHGRDLDQRRPVLPADRGVIVEIQGTRSGTADEIRLQAGLGIHQQLRARVDIEVLEERVQVAAPGDELELDLT